MTRTSLHPITIGVLLLVGVAAPLLFPAYTNQIAVLWLMIVFAMTWDTLGGQMGYNSLGNIFFFGAGMYTCAVVQIGLYYDVGMYTSGARTTHIAFTTAQYFTGFAIGIVAAGVMAAILAVVTSWVVFGLRGPYFAIGTLGVAVAGAELVASWQWVGAASGVSMPVFPGPPQTQKLFFYFLLLRTCLRRTAFSAVALLDEFRHGHQCDPRRRRKGRSDGPATRAATNGRRGLSPRFSSASPAPFSAT